MTNASYYAPSCPRCGRRNGVKAAIAEIRRAICPHCHTPIVTAWEYNEETKSWNVWWREDKP